MSPPIADPSASHMLTGANYSRTFAENLAERSHALRSHGRMVRPTTFLIWQVEVRALLRRATAERRPPCRPRHPPAPLGEFGHEFAERRRARVQGGAHRCARHSRRIFYSGGHRRSFGDFMSAQVPSCASSSSRSNLARLSSSLSKRRSRCARSAPTATIRRVRSPRSPPKRRSDAG